MFQSRYMAAYLLAALFSWLPVAAMAAQGEIRLLAAAGTRMNASESGFHAAIVSEKVGVGYSFCDWLEVSAIGGYTGLYLMPLSLQRDAGLRSLVTAKADMLEMMFGPTLRLGMKSILFAGIGIGPQLGIYRPHTVTFSGNASASLYGQKKQVSFVLIGQASLGVERRFGEHWGVAVRGVADRALWAPSWQLRTWSGSLEAVITYAFFPTT